MQRRIALSVVALSALAFGLLIIVYANASFPLVGHDFSYFIPHLVDSYLHYRVNGLSIQWYTPTFAGGLPAYPNPQSVQFTLPELFMLVMDPWNASLAASLVYIALGFLSAYYFIERILGFSPLGSALGAVFFNVNGFIFTHTIMGQLGYQAFPLLPLLLIALAHPRLAPVLKGSLAALVLAILVHSGGFYTLVIFALSLSIALPALLLMRPGLLSGVRLLPTLFWAVLFTGLLTGSKLYAVMAFMGQFPRVEQDHYATGLLNGLYGIALQLVQSTIIYPVMRWSGPKMTRNLSHYIGYVYRASGTKYGLWEFDSSVSPALWLLALMAPFLLVRLRQKFKFVFSWRQVLLCALLAIAVWITTEFRLTTGLVYPQLQNLPILQSLHVNLRFTAAFILPLSLGGAWMFERLQQKLAPKLSQGIFLAAAALTLLVSFSYLAIPASTFEYFYNVQTSLDAYKSIRQGDTFPIQRLAVSSNLYTVNLLLENASELNPYEPVLGYKLEDFHPQTHEGPVTDEDQGFFNITNPASLVYPNVNHLAPFERIKVTDRENFELFIEHRQPDWEFPPAQRILDFLMGLACVAILLTGLGFLGAGLIAKHRAGQQGQQG